MKIPKGKRYGDKIRVSTYLPEQMYLAMTKFVALDQKDGPLLGNNTRYYGYGESANLVEIVRQWLDIMSEEKKVDWKKVKPDLTEAEKTRIDSILGDLGGPPTVN